MIIQRGTSKCSFYTWCLEKHKHISRVTGTAWMRSTSRAREILRFRIASVPSIHTAAHNPLYSRGSCALFPPLQILHTNTMHIHTCRYSHMHTYTSQTELTGYLLMLIFYRTSAGTTNRLAVPLVHVIGLTCPM